jgi:hypothetical protein
LTGITAGNLPVTPDALDTTYNGVQDSYLMKLNQSGSTLLYSTYLGGASVDAAWGIARDASDNIYVAGETWSADFPTTANALKRRNRSGMADGFVTTFVAS